MEKGVIKKFRPSGNQFLNNLFLVKKRDEANRPVVNLMELNKFISYQHVKMEGLHLLKLILQKVDLMSKID